MSTQTKQSVPDILPRFTASKPTKRNWSSVYGYRPEDDQKLSELGEMFAVISITSEIDFDLANVGGLLLDELQAAYFEDEKRKPGFDRFEQSLIKVKQRVELILAREPDLAQSGVDLELGVLVFKGKYLYGAMVGDSKLFIHRTGHTAEVGKSFIDPEADGFLRSGSLLLEPDDRVLLTTNRLVSELDIPTGKVFQQVDLPQNLESFGSAVIIGFHLAAMPEVEEEPESESQVSKPVNVVRLPGAEAEPTAEDTEANILEPEGEKFADDLDLSTQNYTQESNQDPQQLGDTKLDEDYLDLDDKPAVEDDPEEEPGESKVTGFINSIKAKARNVGGGLKAGLVASAGSLKERMPTSKTRSAITTEDIDDLEEQENAPSVSERSKVISQKVLQLKDRALEQGNYLLKGRPGSRSMYLRGAHNPNRWKTILVVVAILVVALFLVFRRRAEEAEIARQIQAVEQQISQLSSKWQTVKAEVVTAAIGNPPVEQKQDYITQIDSISQDAQELLAKNIDQDKLNNIISETEKSKNELLNIRTFSEPQLVTDLAINFEGAEPVSLVYAGGNVYVLDRAKNQIYRMATTIRSEAAVFASGLVSPYKMTTTKEGDLLVVDQNEDSIIAVVSASTGQIRRSLGLSKARLGTLSAVDIYDANLALYSVNPTKTAIYKQENSGGNYQIPNDAAPWRRDSDLAQAVDITVDFSIFTLIKGRGMVRYIGGEPATYNAAGFLPADVTALGNAVAFELTPTKLYIADPQNKRVVVANRTDENTYTFAEQFVYKGTDEKIFTQITDIAVNEAAKNIFVLDGTRVVRLEM